MSLVVAICNLQSGLFRQAAWQHCAPPMRAVLPDRLPEQTRLQITDCSGPVPRLTNPLEQTRLQIADCSSLARACLRGCAQDGPSVRADQIADCRLQWHVSQVDPPPWNRPDCRLQIALLRGFACGVVRGTPGSSARADQIADCRLQFYCAVLLAQRMFF